MRKKICNFVAIWKKTNQYKWQCRYSLMILMCFNDLEIWYTRVPNLTWSHYRTLLSVTSDDARYWYVKEAAQEMWSVRTLARNVGSQYYHRLLQSPKKETVIAEMCLKRGELNADSTVAFFATVQTEGKRKVERYRSKFVVR